jgi:hypothetical protein
MHGFILIAQSKLGFRYQTKNSPTLLIVRSSVAVKIGAKT